MDLYIYVLGMCLCLKPDHETVKAKEKEEWFSVLYYFHPVLELLIK